MLDSGSSLHIFFNNLLSLKMMNTSGTTPLKLGGIFFVVIVALLTLSNISLSGGPTSSQQSQLIERIMRLENELVCFTTKIRDKMRLNAHMLVT